MSRSYSLLADGVDEVGLNSAWSSLSAGCSNSMIVILVSDVLLLLARLINRQVEVLRSFGRRSLYRFYCRCGRLRRASKRWVS